MKTHEDRIQRAAAAAYEADLEATIDSLFRRHPTLCGFSVQDVAMVSKGSEPNRLEGDLAVSDIGVHPWIGYEQSKQLAGDIAVTLLELMDECREVRELLRGRTFARTIH